MKPITLDTKRFDYNNIQESLVAVPISLLRDYLKIKNSINKIEIAKTTVRKIQTRTNLSKVSSAKTNLSRKKATWILTEADILESGRQAMEEYKNGTLITL